MSTRNGIIVDGSVMWDVRLVPSSTFTLQPEPAFELSTGTIKRNKFELSQLEYGFQFAGCV